MKLWAKIKLISFRALPASLVLLGLLVSAPLALASPFGDCPRLYDHLAKARGANALTAYTSPKAKDNFILAAFKNGDSEFSTADTFARQILELPPEQQAEWRASIGALYRLVPKKPENPFAPRRIGGRRLLDRVLAKTERNDLKLAELLQTKTPDEAFTAFLNEQTKFFQSNYDAEDVKATLRTLQYYLKEFERTRVGSGPTPNFVVGGSFLNGRARLQVSDLDISVSDPKMQRDFAVLEKKINDHFRAKHPEAKLSLEGHGEPEGFYGKLNTLVVRLTPDSATLSIFPPSTSTTGEWLVTAEPTRVPLSLK